MKRILRYFGLFLFLAVLIHCCGVSKNRELPAPDGNEKIFTLATYNVGVFGKSGSNTTQMVAGMIREMGAQAVSLNELDSMTVRHPTYQIGDLSDALGGWNRWFAPAIPYQGGLYGVGIVSEPGLKVLSRRKLTLEKGDGSEQRALAVCEFEDFVFCSTHLDHRSDEARLAQARKVDRFLAENYGASGKPVILCGDFNAEPDSETLALMKENWTVLSPEGFTHSAKNPRKCIDYILVRKGTDGRVTLLEAAIPATFTSGDVTVASDHLPVYVRIKID